MIASVKRFMAPQQRQPLRKTRWSIVQGDLSPPYRVDLLHARMEGLVHSFGHIDGASGFDSCCRLQYAGITNTDADVNCIACALCKGCYACTPGHIRNETMAMGKWETKDGRKLYPFEMDNVHLMNAIAKLYRDKTHFKDDWQAWVKTLEAEARLRKLL